MKAPIGVGAKWAHDTLHAGEGGLAVVWRSTSWHIGLSAPRASKRVEMVALQHPGAEWGWPFFDTVVQEGTMEKAVTRGRVAADGLAQCMQRAAFTVYISCSLPTRPPKRLLLAEDDVDLRALLSRALRREGYEVIEVGCGEGLVASLLGSAENGIEIDVVLTDVQMPKKSGLEALAWMRSSMLRIPTIVISAFCDRAIHVKARGLGALAVLEKPVELGKLRTVLRTYFASVEPVC